MRRLVSSPRSNVWLVDERGTPLVIKEIVGGPDADARFRREVDALRLAGRAEPAVVPALLEADAGRRRLVLQYLDGGDPPEDWIVGYAEALARLHATASPGALPRWSPPSRRDLDAFLGLAEALGVAVPVGARRQAEAVLHRLDGLEDNALLHGDPCPGNDIHTAGGVRFVDLEQAALGPGAVELAYLRIGFPTCWCVTAPPAHLLDRAENAYRDAWRDATGTDVQGDLVDACVGWLVRGDALVQRAHRDGTDHLARLARSDWTWGTVTARQRVFHRLGVVRDAAAGRGDLADLRRLVAAMRAGMRERWPGLAAPPVRRPCDDVSGRGGGGVPRRG